MSRTVAAVILSTVIAGVALLGAASASAAAARTFHTVLEDDQLALFSPAALPQFVRTLRWLGVDELRISAEWKIEAPAPDSTSPPAGVDLGDPGSYDAAPGMQALDRAVRAASQAGIGVIIDPAFSAPLWATSDPPPRTTTGDPWFNTDIDVRELAQWEGMLAARYSRNYTPAGAATPLPRVATFTLWNEPNQVPYEQPQWQGGIAASADWYRSLLRLAYPAIERSSPGATVLIGDTSATGGSASLGNTGVPPLAFIRRLACVDAALRPITTGSCAGFQTLPGDGWAQHPYERNEPPWVPSGASDPDGGEMGDLPALQGLLDKLVAMHRFAPGVANVWLTEQGYGSNAQLPEQPWTESQQADLNAVSEYLAWRDPQVASFSQFLLRDSLTSQTLALRARTGNPQAYLGGTWTTGLEREDGAPKPALAMFRSPVIARILAASDPAASWLTSSPAGAPTELIEVWGRIRPVTAPTPVQVEVQDGGSSTFRTAATTITDQDGVFDTTIAIASGVPAEVRFQWTDELGTQTSPAFAPLSFPVSAG
jgi:hypothetical protein